MGLDTMYKHMYKVKLHLENTYSQQFIKIFVVFETDLK